MFLALIALLLAIILHAPAKLLSRRMPFRLAFALTLLVFFASIAGLLVVLVPQILEQFAQLASQLPPALDSLRDWIRTRTGVPSDGGYLRGSSSSSQTSSGDSSLSPST